MFDQRTELFPFSRQRRRLVFRGTIFLGLAALGCSRSDAPSQSAGSPPSEYLKSLLDVLSKENGAGRDKKTLAVVQNLVGIAHDEAGGSAFAICKSGFYLTAEHNLRDNIGNYVRSASIFDRANGREYPVERAFSNQALDLALVYAPTYLPREAVKDLQLSYRQPQVGERLYLIAIASLEGGEMKWGHTNGVVDPSLDDVTKYKGRLRVKGMTPWAGASGGPVLDSNGIVIALESGSWNQVPNPTRKEVIGAKISPLAGITSIFESKDTTFFK